MPGQVVLYTRVLRCESDSSFCPDPAEQVSACKAYLGEQGMSGDIGDTLRDDGGAGNSLSRPGLLEVERQILARRIDTVVVHTLSCFSTRIEDLSRLWALLKARSVRFIAVRDGIDTAQPAGRTILDLLTRPVLLRIPA